MESLATQELRILGNPGGVAEVYFNLELVHIVSIIDFSNYGLVSKTTVKEVLEM